MTSICQENFSDKLQVARQNLSCAQKTDIVREDTSKMIGCRYCAILIQKKILKRIRNWRNEIQLNHILMANQAILEEFEDQQMLASEADLRAVRQRDVLQQFKTRARRQDGFFPFAQNMTYVGNQDLQPDKRYVFLGDNAYYHCESGFMIPLLIAKEPAFAEKDAPAVPLFPDHHYFVCPVMSDDFRLLYDLAYKIFEISPFFYYQLFNRRYICWNSWRQLRFNTEWAFEKRDGKLTGKKTSAPDAWFQHVVYDNYHGRNEEPEENQRDFLTMVEEVIKVVSFFASPIHPSTILRFPFRDAPIFTGTCSRSRPIRKRVAVWNDLCVHFNLEEKTNYI